MGFYTTDGDLALGTARRVGVRWLLTCRRIVHKDSDGVTWLLAPLASDPTRVIVYRYRRPFRECKPFDAMAFIIGKGWRLPSGQQ